MGLGEGVEELNATEQLQQTLDVVAKSVASAG